MRNVAKIMLIILVFAWMLNGAVPTVENEDKPARGEWDFRMEKVWSVSSAGEYVLVHPACFNFDEAGNLYFLDRKNEKIFVLAPDGKFLYAFGKKGEGPGEIKRPLALYSIGKYLVVEDQGQRIHYFTRKGEYKNSFFVGNSTNLQAFITMYSLISLKSDPEE
ncbi:MAG: hypothetical protein GY757_20900, partial [bacterium]|nr:hypothetical protein [bacterium]